MTKREHERMVERISSIVWRINKYTKTIDVLIKLGWSYNTDFITECHNERAMLMSKIEQETDYEWLPKIWKNGKCVVYDRKMYLQNKKGALIIGGRNEH